MIFLVIYDTKNARLIDEVKEFSDSSRDDAMRALREAQETYLDRLNDIEVAMFEAPTRVTLETTHSRYFKTLTELGDSIGGSRRRSA